MKVVFLDFDGVINTPIWDSEDEKCRFYYPKDGKVNDFQAICWLNELCRKTDAKIVLTTSWRNIRSLDFLTELLYNSELKRNIEIVGKTPEIRTDYCYKDRSLEIETYLKEHEKDNIESFVILDDDEIYEPLNKYWVKCIDDYGFKLPEFQKALKILNPQDTI